jgi:hypothetical protein
MSNPAPTSAEREQFEAHVRKISPKTLFLARWPEDGAYKHNEIESMWAGWQARAAMQIAEPVGPLVGCGDGNTRIVLAPPTIRKSQTVAAPDRAPSIAPASEVACSDCGLTMEESHHLASRRGTAPSINSAADAKNAARYRWLRDRPEHPDNAGIDVAMWENCEGQALRGECLDSAIDIAALQLEGSRHG